MGKKLLIMTVAVAALGPATCFSAGEPKTKAKEPASQGALPVDAQTAFYAMYKPARTWASDVLPLTLTSGDTQNVKNEGGKSGKWTAVFVSASRREARVFTYTVGQAVAAAEEASWSGPTPDSRPFQPNDFTVNSDTAYQSAFKQAEPWLKSHPGKKPVLTLFNASRYPTPVWYIIWGTKTSGYGVLVSAMTGTVLKGK
jgi:hypothetical protein